MKVYRKIGPFFLVLLIMTLITSGAGAAGSAEISDIEGAVNNINLETVYQDGEVMVSLRQMADDFDWWLNYIHDEKLVVINNGDRPIRLSIAGDRLGSHKLPQNPVIINGRTYLTLESAGQILKEFGKMSELLTSLTTDRKVYKKGAEAIARIWVYNPTDEIIKLKYGSGKLYDLYLTRDGREVWRWSDDKFFTMALIQRELRPGEELSYEVKIPLDFDADKYTLSGILALTEPVELAGTELEIE